MTGVRPNWVFQVAEIADDVDVGAKFPRLYQRALRLTHAGGCCEVWNTLNGDAWSALAMTALGTKPKFRGATF